MFYYREKLTFIVIFLSVLNLNAEAANRFLSLSTSRTRALSLSNPAALEGYPAETPLNPAGLTLFRDSPQPRLAIYLNPAGAFVALKDLQEGEYADDVIKTDDVLIPALLLFKGIGLSYRAISIGVILGEQMPQDYSNKKMFQYYPIYDHYFNRIIVKMELDEKVMVGVSAEMFSSDTQIKAVGFTYGVILKPGKLNVGVFYSMLPKGYESVMLPNQRLADETVNAGMSWQPCKYIKGYLGLRNISEENQTTFLEPHSGMEMIPWKHTALRAGYYHEKGEGSAFSLGLGVLDLNEFRNAQDVTANNEYLLDYGVVLLPGNIALHSIALHFRL